MLMLHAPRWQMGIQEFGPDLFRHRVQQGCLIMRGVVRTAFRLSFQETAEARAAGNVEQETRAWKLFTFVPRMLLTKPFEVSCPKQKFPSVAMHSHEGSGCRWWRRAEQTHNRATQQLRADTAEGAVAT